MINKLTLKKERIGEFISEIKKVVSDKQRKPITRILHELVNYLIINKDYPKYYSRNMLHRKDAKNYLDYYIGKKEFYKIRTLVKDIELIPFLENKVLFHHHFKGSDIRLPSFLGYNIGSSFYYVCENKSIRDLNSYFRLIEELIARSESSSVFIKPISGFGGRGCFKVDSSMLNSDFLADVYKKIISAKYLFQETMYPHPLISTIYPHSLNTLRIHTCIYKSGHIGLVSAYMRFGSRGSCVEGGGLGTIYISIDMNTGTLGTYAKKNFEWGGNTYTRHPDTGFEFAGFTVPYFAAALETAKAAAAFLPYRLVGWDIAITGEGPVLLEGNINFGFYGAQIADGGYKKNKVFKQFFDELNNT